MTNLEQARAIFNPVPKKIRGCDGTDCGLRCYEMHHLGTINPPTFSGDDYLSGPQSSGSLMAEWDIHEKKYTRVYGYFSSPFGRGTSEDYTKDLLG